MICITGSIVTNKAIYCAIICETSILSLELRMRANHCGENYHGHHSAEFVTQAQQPNLGYFQTMRDWQEFVNRTPDEYERWAVALKKLLR
jgi:hypothetical protein